MEKRRQNQVHVRTYWISGKSGVCVGGGLTAFAVHVGVTLTVQHSMFVRDSIQQNGDGNEGVTAISYPRHTLTPALALLLHQLGQTLPQLLLLAADANIGSTTAQRDTFRNLPTLLQHTHTAHSSFSFLMELYKTCRRRTKNKGGSLRLFPPPRSRVNKQMCRNVQTVLGGVPLRGL